MKFLLINQNKSYFKSKFHYKLGFIFLLFINLLLSYYYISSIVESY